jgi:hypothetical protein
MSIAPRFSMALRCHDHPFGRHALRAFGQGDAQDRRQQLRRQADGQCDGKQQGVERRAVQQDIDAEHHDGDHQHHPQQQAAETPEATFELGFGRTQRQGLGDPPDFALLGIARDQHLGGAAAPEVPMNTQLWRCPRVASAAHWPGVFPPGRFRP